MLDDSTATYRRVESQFTGLSGTDPVVDAWLAVRNMGVIRAMSYAHSGGIAAISVHVQLGGGSWDGSADAIADWIGVFAAGPTRGDNLLKLAAAPGRREV
jgi:hypothetical protein